MNVIDASQIKRVPYFKPLAKQVIRIDQPERDQIQIIEVLFSPKSKIIDLEIFLID